MSGQDKKQKSGCKNRPGEKEAGKFHRSDFVMWLNLFALSG